MSTNQTTTAYIGIIGAGPAGLAALKSIRDTPQYKNGTWIPTLFEARENLGGVWLPSTPQAKQEHDNTQPIPPTPLYDSLTTNLPHPIMAFSSSLFPPGTPLFPPAITVERYLQDYASSFGLSPHIRLSNRVQCVSWDEKKTKWIVNVTSVSTNGSQTEDHEFDLVLVCNGHHNIPRYPSIPGLQPWLDANLASHSIFYRNPQTSIPLNDLANATILIVGGGPSGMDVTRDVLSFAAKVIFSSSGNIAGPKSFENDPTTRAVVNKPRTSALDLQTKTVTFVDGSQEKIDYCILATGYEVDFPFFNQGASSSDPKANPQQLHLSKSLSRHIDITSKTLYNSTWGVAPLARHLFPFPGFVFSPSPTPTPWLFSFLGLSFIPSLPPNSIAFLGLLVRVAPLPLLECQARAALASFAYPSAMQSKKEWDSEEQALRQRRELLTARFSEGKERVDPERLEEYISRQWVRFGGEEQFDYRDSLDEFAHHLFNNQEQSEPVPSIFTSPTPHYTRSWERELYARKDVLRRAWRTIEARGEADKWLEGVGKGESKKESGETRTPEEEWVDLMWRILDWCEREERHESRELRNEILDV